jgi:hypothetical protein
MVAVLIESVHAMLTSEAALPPCDERLQRLHGYWRSIRPPAALLPGRKHFDPLDVPSLLPWLWLLDVQRSPLRFRYRLVGTVHVDVEGRNRTGQWLDEAHPSFPDSNAHEQYVAAVTRHEIAFYRGPPTYVVRKDYLSLERLVLPLAANGSDVDMLLAITVFDA